MNRLAMAEEIARRVPMLAQRDSDKWKRAEQLRKDFVSDYPSKKIPSLPLDDYVIGKGAENRSFCYRLEREMDILGRILGATAFKFGVYFGRIKSDPEDKYRFRQHWGKTVDQAFAAIKQAIVDLLQAADKDDFVGIAENALSPLFKGKILFLYYPGKFAPIYSWVHLEHFIAALDLDGSFACEAEMQRALMDYRATWPELQVQPAALYMRLLYDIFGPRMLPRRWVAWPRACRCLRRQLMARSSSARCRPRLPLLGTSQAVAANLISRSGKKIPSAPATVAN